ncbi:MAG: hypothetical protein AAGI38_10970 [Bacteroidota bacterium]
MYLKVLMLACVFLGSFHLLNACDCPNPGLDSAFSRADLVFRGKVIGAETNWVSGGQKYSFEVLESWKNPTDKFLVANSPFEKNCGAVFDQGGTYLIFLKKKYNTKYTDACMGNLSEADASQELKLLGAGMPPASSEITKTMMWTVGILGVASLLFLVFVVLRKKIFKRA